MINNVISYTKQDFDLAKELGEEFEKTNLEKIVMNIVKNDLFPLHEIHVIFGKDIYMLPFEADVKILYKNENCHTIQSVIYLEHKILGITSITESDYDIGKKREIKTKVIGKNKRIKPGREKAFLEKANEVISGMLVATFVIMLNPQIEVKESGKKRRIVELGKGDPNELLYHKLKKYISVECKREESNHKGSCPQHEFTCRGHYRRNPKTGLKNIWVREHVKCVGRGTRIIHEYV